MVREDGLICASDRLVEGGDAVRFELERPAGAVAAFVVRYRGQARGFLNRCAHRPMELDLIPGRIFDRAGRYLVCSTHAAVYDPATGDCVGGPCVGASLVPVPVFERDGQVFLTLERYQHERG